jgi:hypothetical protein
MNWTEFLSCEFATVYATTAQLLEKVEPDSLCWKPVSGSNWMTMGQLLKHLSNACGAGCKGLVSGDWGLPEGKKLAGLSAEEMLPPAALLPAVKSIEEARMLLVEDRVVAVQMIQMAGEDALAHQTVTVPWSIGAARPLGWHLFQMGQHLNRHKDQLFYYLKLQGKPVNTSDLWGGV